MADLTYIQQNRLATTARDNLNRILIIGLLLVAITFIIGGLHAGMFVFILVVAALSSQSVRMAGADGELQLLEGSLKYLPDDHTVFNQLMVPSGNGFRELDYVVVAPRGVFIIENKHHRGKITGREHDSKWSQKKVSRKGHHYASTFRNPVRQLKGQIIALKNFLVDENAPVWIEGCVVFSHEECELDTEEVTTPVLYRNELASYIRACQLTARPIRKRAIIEALARLREQPDESLSPDSTNTIAIEKKGTLK